MTNKNRFEDLVKDVDEKFKKIEARNEKVKQIAKTEIKPSVPSPSEQREKKLKKHQETEKAIIKGKLKRAAIVFVIGQLLMIPVYMNHPTLIPQIFLIGSFSLGFICLAVIDYT